MIDAGTMVFEFKRGFPEKSGAYLVELEDNEMLVTFWNDPDAPGVDTWGDQRRGGWSCLTGSRATVKRWASIDLAAKEDAR
jgi:hypothetical protein